MIKSEPIVAIVKTGKFLTEGGEETPFSLYVQI
jgi:hypothetical protein